jgi:ferredoxin
MKVWVDHDLCTGDGLCAEKAPAIFHLVDGISHVRDGAGGLLASGAVGMVPDQHVDAVLDACDDCPGECIFVDA